MSESSDPHEMLFDLPSEHPTATEDTKPPKAKEQPKAAAKTSKTQAKEDAPAELDLNLAEDEPELETRELETTEEEAMEDDVEDDEEQGAFDIGISIPTPFAEPEVDETVEAEAPEVNDDVLQHPQSAPRRHPNKVSFYQEPEDTARLRGAVLHTMVAEGHRSLSQFIIRAVMKEVQRLEDKYNDGKPFPSVGANKLPQGRPQR